MRASLSQKEWLEHAAYLHMTAEDQRREVEKAQSRATRTKQLRGR